MPVGSGTTPDELCQDGKREFRILPARPDIRIEDTVGEGGNAVFDGQLQIRLTLDEFDEAFERSQRRTDGGRSQKGFAQFAEVVKVEPGA